MNFDQLLNSTCTIISTGLDEDVINHVPGCQRDCDPVLLPNEDIIRILDCLYDPDPVEAEKRMAAYNRLTAPKAPD